MSLHRVAEIVIAGAGIAGISAAYQLAVRSGVSRVVIVDPRQPLSLTSSKGSEAYRNYWPGPDDTMVRFMDRSIDLLDALDRESGQAFELNRRGYVFLTADSKEAERLRGHESPTAQFVEGEPVDSRAVSLRHRSRGRNAPRAPRRFHERDDAGALAAGARPRGRRRARPRRGHRPGRRSASDSRRSGLPQARESTRARSSWPPAPCCRSGRIVSGFDMPIANELHGKISFEDDAGVIARDAPLMIWNDAVDLGALGTFPAGVHLRPRGPRSLLGIWTYHTRVEDPTFPPAFAHDYPDIVIRGLAAMMPGLRAVHRAQP